MNEQNNSIGTYGKHLGVDWFRNISTRILCLL